MSTLIFTHWILFSIESFVVKTFFRIGNHLYCFRTEASNCFFTNFLSWKELNHFFSLFIYSKFHLFIYKIHWFAVYLIITCMWSQKLYNKTNKLNVLERIQIVVFWLYFEEVMKNMVHYLVMFRKITVWIHAVKFILFNSRIHFNFWTIFSHNIQFVSLPNWPIFKIKCHQQKKISSSVELCVVFHSEKVACEIDKFRRPIGLPRNGFTRHWNERKITMNEMCSGLRRFN